ncbi:GNAT family N-acetyltransferase [Trinickia mobilis]|uniref:GNAT family N-acetyltransferase n=1 Tax=Trinickia mobilis TaxID=2816356 RepID=UPI001A907E14|nr:drug:proton antiporter [Trinickia mobilis]
MDWKCTEFEQLSTRELYSILRIRSTVFVVEYAHPHLDLDCKDDRALHVFALEREQGLQLVAAYARLLPGDEYDPEITIDRIVTYTNRRDDETHDQLVAHALIAARTAWPGRPIHTNVPADQAAVYERFGFRKAVGPFLEHGMPYINMAYRMSLVGHHLPALSLPAVQWISPPGRLPRSIATTIG